MKPPSNNRLRFEYQKFLEARGANVKTIDAKLGTLSLWDGIAENAHYLSLSIEAVTRFRRHLTNHQNLKTGLRYSASSIRHHLAHIHGFFAWLSKRKGGTELDLEALECLSTASGLRGAGRLVEEIPVYEVLTYAQAIEAMPASTLLERCHRAILSLFLITGVRISALATLRLCHVDLEGHCIRQDAASVAVKNGKSQTTYFFPLCRDAERALATFVYELKERNFPPEMLLFPKDREVANFEHIQGPVSASVFSGPRSGKSIRQIVESALAAIDQPYVHPHQIRKSIAQYFAALALTEEERVAITINLGHEPDGTTNRYYAKPTTEKRGKIIRSIRQQRDSPLASASVDELMAELRRRLV